jgi:cytochrome c-type biogenesis protein CcsB
VKKTLPSLVLLLGVVYIGSTLIPPHSKSEFDLRGFARLPVLADGRIKPLDTIARTSLLILQGRQRFVAPDGSTLSPIEWLLDVFFNPAVADQYKHFRIDNEDVRSLFGLTEEDTDIHYQRAAQKTMASLGLLPSKSYYFSLDQLRGGLPELERQMKLADPVEEQMRSPFQREVAKLYQRVILYERLKSSVNIEDSQDFLAEVLQFQKMLPAWTAALQAKQAGQPFGEQDDKMANAFLARFQSMSEASDLLVIPPGADSSDENAWRKIGDSLTASFARGTVNPDAMAYAGLGHAWRLKQPHEFNEVVRLFTARLVKGFGPQVQKCRAEAGFNQAEPFYSSMVLYVLAFLLAVFSWLKWPDALQRSAFWIMLLAFLVATAGILTRVWLEGRPPVTNLYSSALFVGWVAVALCLVLDRTHRNAIGTAAGGMIGFCTLIIAHHLSKSGDTMEMMRAVLDSNFWLTTHVLAIIIGYGSTFLAGILAIIYIVMGVFTTWLRKAPADESAPAMATVSPTPAAAAAIARSGAETNGRMLERMVYGIVCFATLFSLVGTVLGGIWADQAWGRFWGWDPKENGALILVLWNAIILHCRWGGLVRPRGLMMLAVFGNVVTSWSWFGVNMLGVGLHSYGFMPSAFYWLTGFVVSQVLIIVLAALPLEKWRSFQPDVRATTPAPAAPRKQGLATP